MMAEEKAKRRPLIDPDDYPCPICGEADFVWGVTVGEGPSQRLYTRQHGAGWGEGEVLYTRVCLACRNVQLFTVTK
jgi:hypothetical protein